MDPKTLDKRLQKLLLRDRRLTPEEVERAGDQLEDLSENVAPPAEEELEALKSSLPLEQAVREERIRAAVERYHEEPQFTPEPDPELELELEPEPDPDTKPET
jgi:hypothetical protein